jgi:CheY-like chemotaxis protein
LASEKLLLVDDDESVLTGLGVVLEAHEFEVTTASSVLEALQHIASKRFDVLLSDLHMPGDGDGLLVVGAMRHANPEAVTLLLSANPDMTRASAAILRQVDEILTKPVNPGSIMQVIRRRLTDEETSPRYIPVEAVASVLERESVSVTQAWIHQIKETGGLRAVPITVEEQCEYLPDALSEIVYRLRYPQPLGLMTLFSMASLQHGARRRRQGFPAPVLVEEARALQVALFQTIQNNLDRIGIGQLPATLMAIADEVNAQLLQSLSGYENEKPTGFRQNDRSTAKWETDKCDISRGPETAEPVVKGREAAHFVRKYMGNLPPL